LYAALGALQNIIALANLVMYNGPINPFVDRCAYKQGLKITFQYRLDGMFEVWDLLYSHANPTASRKVKFQVIIKSYTRAEANNFSKCTVGMVLPLIFTHISDLEVPADLPRGSS
jgi:hypothetical protein